MVRTMVSQQEIMEKLKNMLSSHRWRHSVGVQKKAVELARLHEVDVHKASTAGLLHDCAKSLSEADMRKMVGKKDNEIEHWGQELLHAPAGAVLADQVFEVKDQEILSAIRKHTLGGPKMTDLEKVIYLADFIEPGRVFPGRERIEKKAFESLDEGILEAAKQTISYLVGRDKPIHLAVVEMRNQLLSSKLEREKVYGKPEA